MSMNIEPLRNGFVNNRVSENRRNDLDLRRKKRSPKRLDTTWEKIKGNPKKRNVASGDVPKKSPRKSPKKGLMEKAINTISSVATSLRDGLQGEAETAIKTGIIKAAADLALKPFGPLVCWGAKIGLNCVAPNKEDEATGIVISKAVKVAGNVMENVGNRIGGKSKYAKKKVGAFRKYTGGALKYAGRAFKSDFVSSAAGRMAAPIVTNKVRGFWGSKIGKKISDTAVKISDAAVKIGNAAVRIGNTAIGKAVIGLAGKSISKGIPGFATGAHKKRAGRKIIKNTGRKAANKVKPGKKKAAKPSK